jgi:hypothetical protein
VADHHFSHLQGALAERGNPAGNLVIDDGCTHLCETLTVASFGLRPGIAKNECPAFSDWNTGRTETLLVLGLNCFITFTLFSHERDDLFKFDLLKRTFLFLFRLLGKDYGTDWSDGVQGASKATAVYPPSKMIALIC